MENTAIPPQEKERVTITSLDDFEALKQQVEAKKEKSRDEKRREAEQVAREEIAILSANDYKEQEVILPPGWKLVPWTQKMLMDIHEAGALSKAINGEFDNRWRRNYEAVLSVLEHGGFGQTAVTQEVIDGMEWREVEQVFHAILAHYGNTVTIKKK